MKGDDNQIKGDKLIRKNVVSAGILVFLFVFFVCNAEKIDESVGNSKEKSNDIEKIQTENLQLPEEVIKNVEETWQTEKVVTLEEVRENLSASQVRIVAGDLIGSGVIYEITDHKLMIISCKHLFEDSEQATVLLINGQYLNIDSVYLGKDHDVAIAVVDISKIKQKSRMLLAETKKNWKRESQIVNGEEVYIIGSVTDVGSNLEKGYIAGLDTYLPEFDEDLMWGYASIVPGMSGGGIFDASGSYLGILTGGNEEGQFVGVSIDEILETIKQMKEEIDGTESSSEE